MTRLVRVFLSATVIAAFGALVLSASAMASLPVTGIEIEAKSPYCPPQGRDDHGDWNRQATTGDEQGSTCQNNPNLGPADINFALVNTYTFAPKVRTEDGQVKGASGNVDFVNLVCAHGLNFLSLTVENGPNPQFGPPGTIHGFNRIGGNPTETNAHAFGQTAFWATDGSTSAFVSGTQITYNPELTPTGQPGNRLVGGGFDIWMHGLIMNAGTGQAVGEGTLFCTTGEPALYQPLGPQVAPPYFESILNLVPEDPSESS